MSSKKSEIDKIIGVRIRALRKQLGKTGVEFSKQIGISQGHLSDIENGKTPAGKTLVLAISYIYKSDPGWLLTGEGSPYIKEGAGTDNVRPIDNSVGLIMEVEEDLGLQLNDRQREAVLAVLRREMERRKQEQKREIADLITSFAGG